MQFLVMVCKGPIVQHRGFSTQTKYHGKPNILHGISHPSDLVSCIRGISSLFNSSWKVYGDFYDYLNCTFSLGWTIITETTVIHFWISQLRKNECNLCFILGFIVIICGWPFIVLTRVSQRMSSKDSSVQLHIWPITVDWYHKLKCFCNFVKNKTENLLFVNGTPLSLTID